MSQEQLEQRSADESQRALQESEAIANVSRILNQNLELEAIFAQVVHEVIGIIGPAYRAVIHLYDEKNQRLHAVAVSEKVNGEIETKGLIHLRVSPQNEFDFGQLEEDDIRFASMRAGQGVAGLVIDSGSPLMVSNTRVDDRFIHTGRLEKFQSIVVTPILSGERRLGTISVLGDEPDLFTKADLSLLEKLCLQVAVAIENARLLESERQQRSLAQAQAEIAALLNQTLSMDEILAGIINHTRRFFRVRAANIMLVKEGRLEVVRQQGYDPGDVPERGADFKITALPEDHHIRLVCETGRMIMAGDTREEEWQWAGLIGWIRSFACIPLKIGNRVIGLLNVESEIPDAFSEIELAQMETFANSAASAVNNAQLYQDLENALRTEKATRQQLILADKLTGMGRMVASVAHELNNPLQTIKNCLFLIEQSYEGQEDSDLLELALSEVQRLSMIVERLRDVYRPAQRDEFVSLQLAPLFDDLDKLLETHLRRNQVTLKLHPGGLEDTWIKGYPDQLKQVFLNLSLNAIEAMQPEGGILRVGTDFDQQQQQIGVTFTDSGPGVPEADLKVIFDPFYTTKTPGLGLGLSICYDIVHNHSGRIDVKNNSTAGATFTVWLPVADEDGSEVES